MNINVIKRLHTVLRAISSGFELDFNKFQEFCQETIRLILMDYSWYILPPSVHKMLVHGPEISQIMDLPIGFYSEESQEAQNKEIRKSRLHHTTKISRINVMENQFHYLLQRSDPLISSTIFKKKLSDGGKPLDDDLKYLLKS